MTGCCQEGTIGTRRVREDGPLHRVEEGVGTGGHPAADGSQDLLKPRDIADQPAHVFGLAV